MPVPPYDVPVNPTGQLLLTILAVAIVLVAAVAAVRMSRSLSSWGPVATLVGSLLAGFIEPMYCITMHLWYYRPGQWNLVEAFGQSQPIWSWVTYGSFYGGLTLLVWWRIEKGARQAAIWRLTGILVVFFIVLEWLNIKIGTYEYYGPHPFRVFSFPVWIAFVNSAIGIVAGIIAMRLRPVLSGRKAWAYIVVVPTVMPALMIGTTFLALDVINSPHPSTVLVYLAAIVSVGLAMTATYVATQILPAEVTAVAPQAPSTV
jgi:hypothetical protein